MATTEPDITPTQRTYTMSEAVELMKLRDRHATTSPPIRWVSVKTGKPVSIAYT